jgi:hypothetical protein
MRESRLGRWLVGGVLAAAATAFVSTVSAPTGQVWEALPIAGLEASVEADDEAEATEVAGADEATADDTREESVTPAQWEWT